VLCAYCSFYRECVTASVFVVHDGVSPEFWGIFRLEKDFLSHQGGTEQCISLFPFFGMGNFVYEDIRRLQLIICTRQQALICLLARVLILGHPFHLSDSNLCSPRLGDLVGFESKVASGLLNICLFDRRSFEGSRWSLA
jgi:hypothetical protein